jgi:hypothetical protein
MTYLRTESLTTRITIHGHHFLTICTWSISVPIDHKMISRFEYSSLESIKEVPFISFKRISKIMKAI